MSESLKSSTTLTELYLGGDKRKKTHKLHPSNIHPFPALIILTDNKIGNTGATPLGKSLKTNITLIELNLRS